MKLISINDTSRGSPHADFEKKIIYSCSWHPDMTKIALCTVNGHMMIYDALKAKYLCSIAPKIKEPSFKVAWN
jgi:hypothetical protein